MSGWNVFGTHGIELAALHQYPGAQLAETCRDTVPTSTFCVSVTLKPSIAESPAPPAELTAARRFASLPAAETPGPTALDDELAPPASVSELSVSKTPALSSTKPVGTRMVTDRRSRCAALLAAAVPLDVSLRRALIGVASKLIRSALTP
eukprot:scaffold16850_cov58-Phaeocystis_antarctica.AAC.7